MKLLVSFVFSIFISATCLADKVFTIPKEDFVKQVVNGIKRDRIYCYKEDGTKVWFFYTASTILTVELLNKEKK